MLQIRKKQKQCLGQGMGPEPGAGDSSRLDLVLSGSSSVGGKSTAEWLSGSVSEKGRHQHGRVKSELMMGVGWGGSHAPGITPCLITLTRGERKAQKKGLAAERGPGNCRHPDSRKTACPQGDGLSFIYPDTCRFI